MMIIHLVIHSSGDIDINTYNYKIAKGLFWLHVSGEGEPRGDSGPAADVREGFCGDGAWECGWRQPLGRA